MAFFNSVTYVQEDVLTLKREVYTNAKVLQLSATDEEEEGFQMHFLEPTFKRKTLMTKINEIPPGKFSLILFCREKSDKVCRIVNYILEKSADKWKRYNDPEKDPVITNPQKKQSLFINAFQVDNQILILTKFRCIVFDTNLESEEKAINFADFGPNREFETVYSFNKSFNMM